MQLLQDVSPTKPIRHKEAPLSLLGVRGLRDEPLHRSAQCIPQPTQHRPLANPAHKEIAGSSVNVGGSEPELHTAPSEPSNTSSEDDKPKDKGLNPLETSNSNWNTCYMLNDICGTNRNCK